MGGYPSTTNAYTFIRDSDIFDRIKAAQMPNDSAEVNGDPITLQLREENFEQRASDVYAVRWTGGGGFGDPMDRSPADIEQDLVDYAVTAAAARRIYGAVITDEGTVDAAATARHRAAIRAERVRKYTRVASVRAGDLVFEAASCLNVLRDTGGDYWACAKCSTDLGPTAGNFKDGCIREDHPVSASNPLIGAPERFIDDDVAFRQFFCPGCGALIDNEVAVDADPVLADISIPT
jgi:N-methylhydantoinase B